MVEWVTDTVSALPAEPRSDFRAGGRAVRWNRLLGPLATLTASFGTFGFFAIQGILLCATVGAGDARRLCGRHSISPSVLDLGLLAAPELFAGYAAKGLDNAGLRRTAARYGLLAGLLSLAVCIGLDFLFIRDEFRWVLPLACLCAVALPLQQIRLAVQAVDHGQRELLRYNQGRLLSAAAFPMTLVLAYALGITTLPWICGLFIASQAAALLLAQRGMQHSWHGRGAVPIPKATAASETAHRRLVRQRVTGAIGYGAHVDADQ